MIAPRFPQQRCLILTDTDVESLLATAYASEQQSISTSEPSVLVPAWWHSAFEDEFDLLISAIEPALTRQASTFSLLAEPNQAFYPPEDEQVNALSNARLQTRMLTEAAYLALELGLQRVVWPIRIPQQHPDRIRAIGDAIDRALLISRLVTLDATDETAHEVVIETPFVDLSDAQIVELARDMAISLESCWWSHAQGIPLAEQRRSQWDAMSRRSSTQLEPKPGVQTHA